MMPKFDLREADLERQDDDGILCRTCTAPADPEYEPHCMPCGLYWADCADGLWDDDVEWVEGE